MLLMIFLCNDNIKQLSILLGYTAILGTTITRIWVDERCRKRGIATIMLSDLMGAESLTINSVFVPKSHKYLVRVFEKLGFQVYKDYGDLIFMVFN
jgi:ribosomal protein S18 acetylase RimI-like enzyme